VIDRKYDCGYSRLTQVFGRLLHERRLSEQELRGLREDELKPIGSSRNFFSRDGRNRMKGPGTHVEVYAIKVTLLGTSSPVWRRILVPRDITLQNLHRTLQTVMTAMPP
jgi:hypothetical protein